MAELQIICDVTVNLVTVEDAALEVDNTIFSRLSTHSFVYSTNQPN